MMYRFLGKHRRHQVSEEAVAALENTESLDGFPVMSLHEVLKKVLSEFLDAVLKKRVSWVVG
jgi:hypothetical protein